MNDDLPPVSVWLVEDERLKVYNDGKLVAEIPSREFPNLAVRICEELMRQSFAREDAAQDK